MARPRLDKRLGQHHLTRAGVLAPLLTFLRPQAARVVEIGPGGGILTAELLRLGASRVWALEVDPAWGLALRRRGAEPRLQPVVVDGLAFPFPRLPAPTLVCGNLPYNVATALVAAVLPCHAAVPRAAFLLQKEVAERLAAAPGSRAYGSLSVLATAYAEVRILGRVRPGAFRPPPKVESAFVGFTLRPPPLPEPLMPELLALVRQGFAHKRKTLRNALGAALGRQRAEDLLAAAGVAQRARAEELGLGEWLRLFAASRP